MGTHKKGGNLVKKILILILTLVSIIGISITANAYGPGSGGPLPPPPPHWGPPPNERIGALKVLNETREFLFQAQRVAYGPLREDVRHAFDLQANAREFYRQWRHQRAIRLSLRAREIAQDVIEKAERRDPPPPPHHHRKPSIHINLNL
jgi:hypothetical protein